MDLSYLVFTSEFYYTQLYNLHDCDKHPHTVTLGSNEVESPRINNSGSTRGRSKCIQNNSDGIRDTQAYSCGSPECFEHVQNYRGAFEEEPHRTAFEV